MNRQFRSIPRPDPGEYPAYAEMYMRLVEDGGTVLEQLERNCHATVSWVAGLPGQDLVRPYAPGKWCLKDVINHISDDERIYVYRALRFARGDTAELPGFDQDSFARTADAASRNITDLLAELVSVREGTLSFFNSLNDESLLRYGVAHGRRSTVRALVYHIAGHELHHIRLVSRLFG